jgi:3alpha-hydroxysteroid 3-dehydrogenase
MHSSQSEAAGTPRHRRTVAITGSASGIGAAVARRFERSGVRVIGVDVHDAQVEADLSQPAGRAQAVAALTELARGRLDGLVLCAGVGPQTRPTEAITAVNFFGALAVLDAMLPLLAEGDAPAAVVVASNSAGITPAHDGLLQLLLDGEEEEAAASASGLDGATVYGMSKLALTRAMRRRVGAWGKAGVRLNAVAPGPVDTPLLAGGLEDPVLGPLIDALPVPIGRRGNPAEIAAAIGFLLDPANGYIHGSVLFVDGGSDALLRPDGL